MTSTIRKIIYLHPHFTISGGAGRFVLETGKLLQKKGYDIDVISIKSKNKIVGPYKKYINFRDIGGPLSSSLWFWLLFPLSYFKVARLLNREKDYILFPQVFPANWWGFLYKKFHPQTPLIWMCQEPSAFIHSKEWIGAITSVPKKLIARIINTPLSFIDRRLAQTPDLILANSNYTRDYAQRIYQYSPDKLKKLYLGVDLDFFKPSNIKKKEQIVMVGRLTKFKNTHRLLRAFHEVVSDSKFANLVLVIVGEGEDKKNLLRQVERLKLNKKVFFPGRVSDAKLKKIYQESKILILPSEREPFGLVAVEAMACGTPVIASQAGGPAETLLNGQTGFLIPMNDTKILADKIKLLINDRKLLDIMSKNVLSRANEFTWRETTEKLIYYLKKC